MYDDYLRKQKEHQHILSILVHNEPGVLARVAGMFMKRSFNINTLTVGPSTSEGVSRMTISFIGDDKTYEQMVKQLNKLIDVIKIIDLPPESSVITELALVKVKTKNHDQQSQVMTYCQAYRARIISINAHDVIVEIVGKPDKIDSFIKLVKPFGLREFSRTGMTAMARGNGK